MISRSDFMPNCHPIFHEAGFNREAVLSLLASSGIYPAGASSTPENDKNWGEGLRLRKWFSLHEAACIICNRHPDEMEGWWGEPWPSNVANMLAAIIDSASELELDMDGRCGRPEGRDKVSHLSIAGWCTSNGIAWPLSPAQSRVVAAGAGSDIAQRLAAAEVKAEGLTQELATVTRERDKARQDVRLLEGDLIGAVKEAAASKAELASLQTRLAGR
ncbi:hypothetical protein [Chromobacterium paludis]|uniref:Uncharacterized protein n=1 Tax=Chromobacterium paludis TaxID=2605945 RepID=A0A5C1DEC4_9NEIS|nr:hypothetical protein [Chromobacterium paludis]QEL55134.1 hypothetical protein FYK34_05915 [Chromobacterium paludis]